MRINKKILSFFADMEIPNKKDILYDLFASLMVSIFFIILMSLIQYGWSRFLIFVIKKVGL